MKREELIEIPMLGWECYAKDKADSVMDAMEQRIKELEAENELLKKESKRLAWPARALNALSNMRYYACKANGCADFESADYKMYVDKYAKWRWVERKCREKAKEFK